MKKVFIAVALVFGLLTGIEGKDFSSEISAINAAGFPKIDITLKVYNKQPEELKNDNFSITEDGKGLTSFSLEFRKSSHYMVLVIDRSSSIEPAMNQVKAAAASFVNSMNQEVTLSILSFGSDMDFAHDFSRDGQSLVTAINKIKPWGGTALYDALYTACDELQNKAGRNDLKTVVCLTDGRDSTPNGKTPLSTKTPAEVTAMASEKGIRLITVGLGADIDEAILKGFAQSTGGWYLQTTSAENLAKLYEALSRRMKLEKYYRLVYTTPKPEADGSKRTVEISSKVKGFQDQGKGQYTAPTRTVSIPEPSTKTGNQGEKMSVTSLFNSLQIDGPDTVFLTSPIIVPNATPVHGPNGASFLGASADEKQAIIDQARLRISENHKKNLERQQAYLKDYSLAMDRIQKINDERGASPDLKDFEKPRIQYRSDYIQMRRDEINIHSQKAYDCYLINLQASMDELDYQQKIYVGGQAEDEQFFETNNASESAALAAIDKKYAETLSKLEEKQDSHFNSTLESRGSNVTHTTHIQTREINLPEKFAVPHLDKNRVKELIDQATTSSDDLNSSDSSSDDSGDSSGSSESSDNSNDSDSSYSADDSGSSDDSDSSDSSDAQNDETADNNNDNDNGSYDATTSATKK